MRTGELSRATGVNIETIRYYERAKLLPRPKRQPNGYRAYSRSHVERLAFIRQCRALGMPLSEVRLLLDFLAEPARDCSDVDRVIETHLAKIRARLKSLRALERQLATLRARCRAPRTRRECGIVHQLVAAAQTPDALST